MRGTGDTGCTAPRSHRDAPQGTEPTEHGEPDDEENYYKALMEDPAFVQLTGLEAAKKTLIGSIDGYTGALDTLQCEVEDKLNAYLGRAGDEDVQQDEIGDEELKPLKALRDVCGIPESIRDAHDRSSEASKEFEEKDRELGKSL